MEKNQPLIEAKNITFLRSGKKLLSHVDLSVSPGEIVTLIGPNGGGKTSLVKIILGLILCSQGEIFKKPDLTIGYMPQKIHMEDSLPLDVSGFLRLVGQISQDVLLACLEQVGALHLQQAYMTKLSGGELQRVLLARAILAKPQLLVLDEPAQGVDISGQVTLYKTICKIRQELGCGILMVSHDLHMVMAQTDRVVCLNQHICCSGTPEAVSKEPGYLELFGDEHRNMVSVYTHHHDHQHRLSGEITPQEDDDV